MKRKTILSMILFFIIGGCITTSAQVKNSALDNIYGIKLSEIHSEYFQKVFKMYDYRGHFKLPFFYDKRFSAQYIRKNKLEARPYVYSNDITSPFYVNTNKKETDRNDKETTIYYMFYDTNGKYMLSIIAAVSPDHYITKFWLVTFDLFGKRIDWIPFAERYMGNIRTIEGQISQDLKVDVQQLDFFQNDYIMKDNKLLNNLKGQRIDRKYQITPEGKFTLLKETKYQPQIYTVSMLTDEKCIVQRNEKAIQ